MIPLIKRPIAQSSTGTGPQEAGGLDTHVQRNAWKREMERAQSQSWFKARTSAPGSESATSAAPLRPDVLLEDSAVGNTVTGVPTATGVTGVRHLTLGAAKTLTASTAVRPHPPYLASADVGPSLLNATIAQAPPPYRGPLKPDLIQDAGTMVAQARTAMPAPTSTHAPIRMHAQWKGDTVAIWIGIDADQAAHAEQLIDTLRAWLQGQGLSATSIVCNGRPIWPATDEPPTLPRMDHSSTEPPSRAKAGHHHFHITATQEA